jgi:acetyl esterase
MTNVQDAGLGSELDPDIRRFQQVVNEDYARLSGGDFSRVGPAEARRIAERVRARWTNGGPAMARTEELRVGPSQVRLRIHHPAEAPAESGALIYIHGGGWTVFSLDTHDRLMREYAARGGFRVVGVDYSLSPEAKFPQAIDEIVTVVRWLRAEGRGHGIDPDRIAIGGDSAGANLSVATNLRLRALGEPVLAAMLLNYGVFSPEAFPSYERFDGPDYMLTVEEMERFWRNYLTGDHERADPLASVLAADLKGLPPAHFTIAPCDILADSNYAMAEKLRQAGGEVAEMIYPGTTHSFLEAMSIAAVSNEALDEASGWLAGIFARR